MIPWWVSLSDGYLIQNIMFENCNCFALFFNAFCRQQLGLSMKAKLKSMLHKRVCMSNTCHFFTFSYNPVEVMGQYQWVESMLLKIIMLAVAFSTQLYVLLVWEAYWHNSTYANLFYVYIYLQTIQKDLEENMEFKRTGLTRWEFGFSVFIN